MRLVDTPSRGALAWRGLANLLLGIILVAWPQATVYVVVLFFALNLILVGLFAILEPLFNKKAVHVGSTIALGVLGVTFGVYLIIRPEFAASIVGLLIAFWALLFGVFDLMVSTKALKAKAPFAWIFVIVGVLSVLFGLYMLFSPLVGILTIVWLFGIYAITVGAILLLSSIFMRPTKQLSPKS